MKKNNIKKVEEYLEERRLNNPYAERLLEMSTGKPDYVKDGLFNKYINYKILQKINYGGFKDDWRRN